MWDPYAEFQSATLPNGLTVHAAHWPNRPWEAMGFLIHSGAFQDAIGLEGTAHFVEHLVSQNAGISNNDIRKFFEGRGGLVGLGSTTHHDTQYSFFVPADIATMTEALSIFGRMLIPSRLEKQIEPERQVIIGEFNRRFPMSIHFDLAQRRCRAINAGDCVERSIRPMGKPESINRIAQEDLQSFYDSHYTPANISVVGVGCLDLAELIELLYRSPFSMSKTGSRATLPDPVIDVTLPTENYYVFEMSKHMPTVVPRETLEYLAAAKVPGNINQCATRIVCDMLDYALNQEIREHRAWAYAVECKRCNLWSFNEIEIFCPALALSALDEIDQVVNDCIDSLNSDDLLFEQMKQDALAGCLMIDPTGRNIRDGAIDDISKYQRIITLAEYAQKLERLQMADMRHLLAHLKPERRWTLLNRP